MKNIPAIYAVACFGALLALAPQAALARQATCMTTQDGTYDCKFESLDNDGSFEISAPNKPTFTLFMDSPGVAQGSGDYGTGRNVPHGGNYIRQDDDQACWVNDLSQFKICAW